MSAAWPLRATVRAYLDDRTCSWSIGAYGAIAEFHWLPGDAAGASREDLQIVTGAGALRVQLRDDVVAHAYLNLSRHPHRWLHGITLCLPWRRARTAARQVLTELGPDQQAIRHRDRRAVLFDLGLGLSHVDACVRSEVPELLTTLRAACGQSLLGSGNALMAAIKEANPHRVFMSRLGRVEVYQPIGRAGDKPPTPLGPHTHLLPRLLASRRASAEAGDAPAYHRACVYLYPRHRLMNNLGHCKTYDGEAHAQFTALLERWGDKDFLAQRQRAMDAMRSAMPARRYPAPADPRSRHALRIAIRELAQELEDTEIISDWRRRFDRVRAPSHAHLVH